MSAEQFMNILAMLFAKSPQPSIYGGESWTHYMTRMLHLTAKAGSLVCCCHQGNITAHEEIFGAESGCEYREYLFDLTWYSNNNGYYEQPAVIIEQENHYDPSEFRLDFWKLMVGYAPLRVMVGYTKTQAECSDRIDWLNQAVNENQWNFPPQTEDLVLVGYQAMEHGDFLVAHRPVGEVRWSNRGSLRSLVSDI